MVAKLSSVRIITAASLETSVPVMPMATPMSAAFSAGASFTPSPVIATTLPERLSSCTSRILSSGATRAITPMSSSCASRSSSLIAANSVPVSARPSMPSSPAIAAAVVAWSPVIIRTRMPASWHSAMAAFASGRGGSTMPDHRQQRQVGDQLEQVRRPGSKVAGSKSRWATTITRSPEFAMPVVRLERQVPVLVGDRDQRPVRRPVAGAARDQHVRRALDVAPHHRLARRRRSSRGRWP